MRAYAGIGSRSTPPDVLVQMTRLAAFLGPLGYALRSGGASGADLAFEEGATVKEIYLPWSGFNGSRSRLFDLPNHLEAAAIASRHHPRWSSLGFGARKLHARNAYQVLGERLNSCSDFVLCWTPDGAETREQRSATTGGTGLAISVASEYGVPVFNMARPDALSRLSAHVARSVSPAVPAP